MNRLPTEGTTSDATIRAKATQYFKPGDFPVVVLKNEHHGRIEMHRHDFFELVYIDRGVALHSHEGRIQILTAGDIFIIPPGEAHSYLNTQDTGLYNCLYLPEALVGMEEDIGSLDELGWMITGQSHMSIDRVHAGMPERQEVVLILEQIVWERLNRPIGWRLKLRSLFIALLVSYARLRSHHLQNQEESNPAFRQVLKAVAFIEKNYIREPTVEKVAQEAGMSAGHLSRQFKSLLGTSPSEYARSFRIAKAAELLRQEDKSIADVAREMGYGDIALFSRQFRQVTGMSPTGFRKNQ